MRLTTFSIENYRSITDARKISIGDYTVLLGPNNEGKSNILKALNLGMSAIEAYRPREIRLPDGERRMMAARPLDVTRRLYDWNRDFPINRQAELPNSSSFIQLDFELTDEERTEFRRTIGSSINELLPLRMGFGPNKFSLSVHKRGPGQKELNKKAAEICGFVFERIRFEYIPAIRTAEQANEVINRLIESELWPVEEDKRFQDAVRIIDEIQRPILDKLAQSVTQTIRGFLPSVNKVSLELKREQRFRSMRRDVGISVDDGVLTPIERKGDGVQSLVALAMMRHMAEQRRGSASSILAIEEPESHLHPYAVRELRRVVLELSSLNQVLVSSHSPLFVYPTRLASNLLVQDTQATPAKSIQQIRSCLGVRFSDNLQNAEVVLLVEGKDDKIALSEIIMYRSEIVRRAMTEGVLAIDTLDGGSNLSYKAGFYVNAACSIQCLLDHDASGIDGANKAMELKYITDADVNFTVRLGKKSSEFEDLLDEREYHGIVLAEFGVDIKIRPMKKQKWAERTRLQFLGQGQDWNDRIEAKLKAALANWASAHPSIALHPDRDAPISSMIKSLERKLAQAGV